MCYAKNRTNVLLEIETGVAAMESMVPGAKNALMEKLAILTDAAKYDVACTSSGVDRSGASGRGRGRYGGGSHAGAGIGMGGGAGGL